jgi:hypothetical protein
MAVYQYKAREKDGKIVTGLVEAPSESVASRLLHEKQFFVISLRQSGEKYSLSAFFERFARISSTDIVNFTRKLATMVVQVCLYRKPSRAPLSSDGNDLRASGGRTFYRFGGTRGALSKYSAYFQRRTSHWSAQENPRGRLIRY